MSVQIVSDKFGSKFMDLLENCKRDLLIVVPYIGSSTAAALAKHLEQSEELTCTIITRFYRDDFISGASNIYGLEQLLHAGAKLYALKNLHTKLYIFDNESVITGSFNFTFNGFYKNHEFGVLMEEEPSFTKECTDYFNGVLTRINDKGNYLITQSKIDNEKDVVIKSKRIGKKKDPTLKEYNINDQWGAEIKGVSRKDNETEFYGQSNNDFIEESLNGAANLSKRETGIWIKFEGSASQRIENNVDYMNRKEGLYEHKNRTFFKHRPLSIKEGQTVFIAVLSTDNEGNKTPIIVGYAKAGKFIESNKVGPEDRFYRDTNGEYTYYIDLNKAKYLTGPIINGISIYQLCEALGSDLYPTYKDDPKKILSTHHRHSHLQITEKARDYLHKELNSLFDKHGHYSSEYGGRVRTGIFRE